MGKSLKNAVAVVTGASSGIGRATALEFARRGAHVVLAARREEPLHDLVAECERMGVRAVAVPCDVAEERAVSQLANQALSIFGKVDIWVNNAGVYLAGRFEQQPIADIRRLFEVNFFGVVYGSRAALPIFRRQGRGVLINIGSLNSKLPTPYFSAYAASKHAVAGLSGSLRQELMLEGAENIHVCTVMPQGVDTPIFQHAGNYSGRALKALPPVASPERAAKTIVDLAERPRREVFVGNAARLINLQHLLAPGATEALMARTVDSQHFQDSPAPPTRGAIHTPMREGRGTSGGWKSPASRPPALGLLAAGALALATPFLLRRRQPQPDTTLAPR
jgi:short-subunit dehydrogenase